MDNQTLITTGAYFLMNVSLLCTIVHSQKRHRRFKVRPINRRRKREGFFATIIKGMQTLEWDEKQFIKYSRMTRTQFQFLLKCVGPHIQKDVKKYHLAPEHRLMITLHYLAEGCSMQEISWGYRIGHATAHQIIEETCQVIWDVLSPSELPTPTIQNWKSISDGFFKRWNLPNCVGALDGKHINIRCPPHSGSQFFNHKKDYSIVLMASCDAFYRFSMVDIGAAGFNHDSAVFRTSGLGNALMTEELDLPPPTKLPGSDIMMNHFLVADAAFPLHKNIIRPYAGSHLGEKKKKFNYRISRARRTIESTFGILSQRWGILLQPINASLEVVEGITRAVVVLHNYLQTSEMEMPVQDRNYCPTGKVDYVNGDGVLVPGEWTNVNNLPSVRMGSNNATSAKNQRDALADYFISDVGGVDWQSNYVNRGAIPEN